MSAHTPGPWEATFATMNGHPVGNFAYVSKAGCSLAIVHCYAACGSDDWMRDQAMENAQVMAAGPDLLSALDQSRKYVAFAFDQGIEGADQAGLDIDAAIKKARGE